MVVERTIGKVVGGRIASQREEVAGHLLDLVDRVSITNAAAAATISVIHSVGYFCCIPKDSFSEPDGGGGVWLLQKSSPALHR